MSQTANIIEEIRTRLKLEDLVAKTYTVTGRGRVLSTVEHDSLKFWPATGRWWWFSQDIGGDIIDWYRHVHRCDLGSALDALAALAGVERRPPTPAELQQRQEAQTQRAIYSLAATWFAQQLQAPAGSRAQSYCSLRGWTAETIQRERIGYNPPAHAGAPLSGELHRAGLLDHPTARAILAMPGDMLVYAHRDHGAVVYLSARSIEGKRHWNLPAELAGAKRLYPNTRRTGQGLPAAHLLVEGQADAISLGQLGVEATALCGLAAGDDLVALGITHVALDNDNAGQAKAVNLALALDPFTKVAVWPDKVRSGAATVTVKDAADLLRCEFGATDMASLLAEADSALIHLARKTHRAKGDDRRDLLDQFFRIYTNLDEMVATDLKPDLAAALCGGIGQFNRLLKAHQKAHQGDKENDSPERYENTCGQVRGGFVFEQCVTRNADGQCQVMFAVRQPDGAIEMRRSVELGGVCYLPYPGSTAVIDKQVVLFPERIEEYGTPGDLVNEVRAFIHKYLDIDPFYEKLAAYYVLFTWVYDIFENVPYIRALGDYGTGKTRFLQAIGAACYRPMFVSGAATVSPIFRLLHMFRGTLIIDEADFSNSDAEAEIIKILNVGYYRGGVVLRSEKDPNSDDYFPSVNEVFGPKILATRKPFTDRATESRCLTKRMATRRPRPGIPYTVSGDFWREATALRNKLLLYRLRNHRPVTVDQSLADESVEPRLNQITMALKTIIEDITMRGEIDTFIRAYNDLLIGERQLTLPAIVVQAVVGIYFAEKRNLMGEDMRDLSMKGIADKALAILQDIDSEAKLTPRRVSLTLNEDLGLTRRELDKHTNRSALVCDEEELVALMQRYGIGDPRHETL